jgi:hypothetical protein
MENRRSLPPYEDELSLALLRSADHDEPSAAAYSKVAATLGVSAAVGLGASLPVAALTASGASASNALRWSGSLFVKGVVVAVSSVLLVAAGVALHRARGPAAPNAERQARVEKVARGPASAASPAAALVRDVAAPTPPPTPPGMASAAVSLPSAVTAASARPLKLAQNARAALGPSTPRAPQKSSLPEQVLSLDRARVALSSGDPGAALSEIAHYRSTWPHGVFLTEASVLEIEALAKRGEIVLAGMRAQAFVTAHPDSPQAERLRALIPGAAR